jgi:cytochrome c oxidase subunit 2
MFAEAESGFRLFPEQASTVAPQVDAVFYYILGVSVFFSVLIAVLVIAFAVKYRRRSEAEVGTPTHGSLRLEAAWIIIPFILVMIMFVWGTSTYFAMARPPDDAMEIYVVSRQWMWKVQHPGGQSEINELHIPVGQPVKLVMTSEDVIHDFYVPAFRTKQDVVPGRYTRTWFQATKTGDYHLFCAEYCGTEHSRMGGWVHVMEPEDYEKWLADRPFRSMSVEGRNLFYKLQCVTCHSANAQERAPNLEGLYGSMVTLREGKPNPVRADEDYIRESILKPDAKVVSGYEPIMPVFLLKKSADDKEGHLTEEEMMQLIAFIKSLRHGDTPPRVEQAIPPERRERKKDEKK